MSTASEILMRARNAEQATKNAEEASADVEQDWANEATLYTFPDGSVLVASGPQINAYADRDAADAALDR